MTINFANIPPNSKILELGGGASPHPSSSCNVDCRQCYNQEGKPTVNFTVDFGQFPWPMKDSEWDAVLGFFVLEHISYVSTRSFLKEVIRIAKPGAKVVFTVPDTLAQIQWVLDHQAGWDGNPFFESASCKIYGDQNHSQREGESNPVVDSHKAFFSHNIIQQLFSEVGFENILTTPYGERKTDLCVTATKPVEPSNPYNSTQDAMGTHNLNQGQESAVKPATSDPMPTANVITQTSQFNPFSLLTSEGRKKAFDRNYFSGGSYCGGYKPFFMDFSCHELSVQNILKRKPESVLEIGDSRGYLVKRLEDYGISSLGMDISRHCFLTRATENHKLFDVCETPWPLDDKSFDLCESIALWDHLPEELIPKVAKEMERVCKRGYHGINFNPADAGDQTRVTVRDKNWWFATLPPGHEVVSQQESEQGEFPKDYFEDKGLVKVQAGSAWCMFHHGWVNLDIMDLTQYAQQNNYRFAQCDITKGIPFDTGKADCFYLSHVLEHFNHKTILSILRDVRRIIKPEGVVRIIVPDADMLIALYQDQLLGEFDQLQSECASAKTQAEKLTALMIGDEHKSLLDEDTLCSLLEDATFIPIPTKFRETKAGELGKLILRETIDSIPCLSLFMEAIPKLG